MIEWVRALFFLCGSLFVFTGALGIVVMPDVLSRAHALSKALTLGVSLMLIGLLIGHESYTVGTKIILAIAFQFVTIPLSGHIFALYAYSTR
jgi:multicomponent Na+:H+ antiporter subunit G